ncbi:hypothetical protein F5X68DRAFT_234502 [Plectosphaerella plurivora]|uniref:Uncharacterized protein n=1 Tax=Plectosphaerella plurivora TaxID=936078 RepID=A0A9P8V4Q7_9PEZI|nr:hypothetical protein F5X68DRAFT_234502 [Plectosphaerella plurivora]
MVSFRTLGLAAMAIPALALPVVDSDLQQRQDEPVTEVHATFTFPLVQDPRHTPTATTTAVPDDINPCAAVLCLINTTCVVIDGEAQCVDFTAVPTVITAEPTIFTSEPIPEPTSASVSTSLPTIPGPGGVQCGKNVCDAGQICCNPSCGICTPPDGACIMIFCPDGQI